jgi:hypothetical protein
MTPEQDPDAVAIGELFRKAKDALGETEPPSALREGEILPKKFRRAVTRADQCYWCEEPFAEPKRKRFVIMDCRWDRDRQDEGWHLRSICFECFKNADVDSSSGIEFGRINHKCQGCGEPISLPIPGEGRRFCGSFRWFNWGVCSMRCYQRLYRKRRRNHGSTIAWKPDRRRTICEACKRPLLKGQRRDTRFCSNRCRQWTYRQRRRAGS